MELSRRQLLISAGVLAPTAALLTACGGGAKPGAADEGEGFSVWTLSGTTEAMFKASFDEWDKANPTQKISVQNFAGEAYKEKIRTAVGSGNAPTLIWSWAGGTLAEYVKNGKVIDLTGKVAELEKRIIPSVLAAGKVDGKLYAVPNNAAQPVVLYFNKKVFADAGVQPPTSWDDLLKAVQTFKSKGITPMALAGASKWPELMYIQYLTDRIGGPEVFSKVVANTPDAWSDPAIASALDRIAELRDAGAFGKAFGSVVADNNADVALVHTGKAAMVLQGSWAYATFKTDAPDFVKAGDLGYLNFPALAGGKGDPKNIVGNPSNFWSISAKASDGAQQAAAKYLDGFNVNSTVVDVLLKQGSLPVALGLESKLEASEDKDFLLYTYSMLTDAPHFQLSWDQALASAPAQALLDNLAKIFLGTSKTADFVAAMNGTIK